jgi:hypothetical protein
MRKGWAVEISNGRRATLIKDTQTHRENLRLWRQLPT